MGPCDAGLERQEVGIAVYQYRTPGTWEGAGAEVADLKETPSSKHQAPEKHQIPNTKHALSQRLEVRRARLGPDALGIEQFASLEIAVRRSAKPNAVRHTRSVDRERQLLQRADHAAQQVDLGAEPDVGARDLELLGVNPKRARAPVQHPVNHVMDRWRRRLRLEVHAIGAPTIDRLGRREREGKARRQFRSQRRLTALCFGGLGGFRRAKQLL